MTTEPDQIHPDPAPSVELKDLKFAWSHDISVLSIKTLCIHPGEKVFLQGASGSGKSTLLGIIAGVFAPSAGEATVLGQPFHTLKGAARDLVRADDMGVIFQQFNLVPYLNLIENVLLPCRFSQKRAKRVGPTEKHRVAKAKDLLNRLGLEKEAVSNRNAALLSVGQQQRVAAARALIGAPGLVIADEPTSSLDTDNRESFIETLLTEAQESTVIFVSHDASLSSHFDRHLNIGDLNGVSDIAGKKTPKIIGAIR